MGIYQEAIELKYSKDVNYVTSGEHEKMLQMIYPDSKGAVDKTYPGILYVLEEHSDPLDIYEHIPSLVKFAQRGYVVALMKHHPVSDDLMVADDCEAALQFLLQNADIYHLDQGRLCLWRDAIRSKNTTDSNKLDWNQKDLLHNIKAVISLGGTGNIATNVEKADFPPTLLVAGDKDAYDNNWWSEQNFDVMEDFMSNYV